MNKLKDKFKGEGILVITISEKPKELWDRLRILTPASKGHNSSLNEKSAILDKLLHLG